MDEGDPERILQGFEAERAALLDAARGREAGLPARWLHQPSHYTVPASDPDRIRKAAGGMAPCRRLLDRLGLAPAEVAAAVDVDAALLEDALARGAPPPVVIVDGEDATALDPDVQARARTAAVEALCAVDWGRTLALYMPSGLELAACARDLVDVVGATLRRGGRLDGVVWPKARHEDELRLLDRALAALEPERGQVRVVLMVESAAALTRLPALTDALRPRLAALVLGLVDLASDLGLPEARQDHPALDAARVQLVQAAAAVGVPAIDAMTFDYPVRDPSLDDAANRTRALAALATCARDARRGAALGLAGKWVGHPLQLLVNEVVRRAALGGPERLARDVAEARAYAAAVRAGRGAIAREGRMLDRATDRHVRVRLRAALAHGLEAASPRAGAVKGSMSGRTVAPTANHRERPAHEPRASVAANGWRDRRSKRRELPAPARSRASEAAQASATGAPESSMAVRPPPPPHSESCSSI
ncbi:MAG: aldolase/citrate lyase family protein [Planctomycetes bacterium]|nr:aldolase/citrate lyase family protein [Planctomycetota bacterium]